MELCKKAIKIYNELEYDIVIKYFNNKYNVANKPIFEGTPIYPFYVQLAFLPLCNEFVRCYNTNTQHNNYIEYKEFEEKYVSMCKM